MNWENIIIAIAGMLITGGGVVTIATLKDRKTELFLKNVELAISQFGEVIKQYQLLIEDRKERATELKNDLDKKDEKIEHQYDELREERERTATLMHKIAGLEQKVIMLEFMRCTRNDCAQRQPPRKYTSDAIE